MKRVVTIALGVAAAAWLWLRDARPPPDVRADPEPTPIQVELPARPDAAKSPIAEEGSRVAEAARGSSEPPAQPDDGARGLDAAVAEALLADDRPDPDAPARSFAHCKEQGLSLQVCKGWFERRDRKWAPDAEQRIRELLTDVDLVRLSSRPVLGRDGPLHCRATYCLITLELDRTVLADPVRWAIDRAEELRFALIFDGLSEEDAEVEARVFYPVDDEKHAYPTIWLHRCAKTKERC